ncbi:rhamnose ABC transporter substrate-binding protein [Kaistia granuli]|uniref:rhamnose ABC transporter substrate-binding protein n=1 Tax=Kaistia granuli TaxID=363259 RepID=UPI000375D502
MTPIKTLGLGTALVTSLMLSTVTASVAETRIAVVAKDIGNGFFVAAGKGAEEAAKEIGDTSIIFTGPTEPTAEGQIEVINALIAQKVDAIVISANDPDALVPALQKAKQRGIVVVSFDSGVAPEGRDVQLDPSSVDLIGKTIIKLAADHLPDGKGKIAFLSGTATATNQNAWLAAAKTHYGDFPGVEVVATVYGDDLFDKSYREAQGLISTHPDLAAISAPTTVGIVAAAQAVTDAGKIGKINVTGLALPSEMAAHIKSGASKSFAIWNPIDLGYSATMIANNLIKGNAKAEPGAEISIGRVGKITLDDNRSAAMSDPFTYDASNIDQFSSIF